MLTRKPQKGDRIRWPAHPGVGGIVTRVGPYLCWYRDARGTETCFVWWFPREGSDVGALAQEVEVAC
jgi:hypothetical protein